MKEHGEKLTTATIDYVSLTPSALHRCLEHLPNVVDLTLLGRVTGWDEFESEGDGSADMGAAEIDENILFRLTPSFKETGTEPSEPCICPRIRKLRCIMRSGERNEKLFLEMVLARYGDGVKKMRGLVRRIEEVVLDYNRPQAGGFDLSKELEAYGVDTPHLAIKISYKNA